MGLLFVCGVLFVFELKQVFRVLNELGSLEFECTTIFKTDISIKMINCLPQL